MNAARLPSSPIHTSQPAGNDSEAKCEQKFSAAPFAAGRLVLVNRPWVSVVSDKYLQDLCHSCFAQVSNSRKKCSACQRAYYCSKQCQSRAWKQEGHKQECFCFKQWDSSSKLNTPSESVRFAARTLFKLNAGENGESENMADPRTSRTYDNLISHWDVRKRRPQERAAVAQLQTQLRFLIPDVSELRFDKLRERFLTENLDELGEMYGKWQTNAMTIDDYEAFEPCGIALYLSASIFDHSCYPNCAIVNRPFSNTIEIRALENVERFEDLRICYLAGGLQFRDDRRRDLEQHYHFWCNCIACNVDDSKSDSLETSAWARKREDSMRAMRCTKCGSGAIPLSAASSNSLTGKKKLTKPSFPCDDCKYAGTVDEARRADHGAKECLKFIDSCDRGEQMPVPKFALLREMLNKSLAPFNFLYAGAIASYLGQLSEPEKTQPTKKDAVTVAEAAIDALQAPRKFLHANHFYLAVKYLQFLRFMRKLHDILHLKNDEEINQTRATNNLVTEEPSKIGLTIDEDSSATLDRRYEERVQFVRNAYNEALRECRRILNFYRLLSNSDHQEHQNKDESQSYFSCELEKF